MDLLRFTTAGSIDDGKSTLIGKLLHDTGNIKEDVAHSIKGGSEDINLAHITDGLRSERDGGITIDIGYKYFNTETRKFIIADAPGHFQYTKNLVTGASNVDLIIVLVDAGQGVSSQTRMHLMVASFLKLRHVLVAINKMDLVEYSEVVFNQIKNEIQSSTVQLGIEKVDFIPISALKGDNVIRKSEHISWYNDFSLLERLNNYETGNIGHDLPVRIRIQYTTINDNKQLLFGKLLSGTIKKADLLCHYKTGNELAIDRIIIDSKTVDTAKAQDNICLVTIGNSDLQRGDTLGRKDNEPRIADEVEVDICWLDSETELKQGAEYFLRLNAQEVLCVVLEIIHKRTIADFGYKTDVDSITVNEFARIKLKAGRKVVFDTYSFLPDSGRGILIDKETNNTVAAVVV